MLCMGTAFLMCVLGWLTQGFLRTCFIHHAFLLLAGVRNVVLLPWRLFAKGVLKCLHLSSGGLEQASRSSTHLGTVSKGLLLPSL